MSQYKIDGHIMSINELNTWIAGFVTLHRKRMLDLKKIPADVVEILKQTNDRKTVKDIMIYLTKDEDYLNDLIKTTQIGMTELAIVKDKS